MAAGVSAQETKTPTKSQFTINTRAWSSNYWTTLLYNIARDAVTYLVFDNNPAIEAAIPSADLAFPIGMGKEGFADPNDIYGPYHRAFGTPFKRLGDFSIGLDASWVPSVVGVYAGAYYKSQEICFMANDQNLRGNYFQPRAGLVIGGKSTALEAGVFYDYTVGCTGTSQVFGTPNKDMIASGLGLDFAISYANNANSRKVLLMFSMPLHNFLNEDYTGLHRRHAERQGTQSRLPHAHPPHHLLIPYRISQHKPAHPSAGLFIFNPILNKSKTTRHPPRAAPPAAVHVFGCKDTKVPCNASLNLPILTQRARNPLIPNPHFFRHRRQIPLTNHTQIQKIFVSLQNQKRECKPFTKQ